MNKSHSIGVSLICYNNEKTIEKALLSILNQTLSPDAIVISDDKSTDNSVNIINKIIKDYPKSNIYLFVLDIT